MKKAHHWRPAVLAVAMSVFANAWTQADPSWLRSWNEARANKPQSVASTSRIAAKTEPGSPLVIRGQVVRPDGTPARNVLVHAYHRDQDGLDFGPGDNTLTTWRLNGWAQTDGQGSFEFRTIRPAPDHLGREGAHIHFTLETVDFGRQWAPTVFFADDPMVSEAQRRRSAAAAPYGWVVEPRIEDGVESIEVRFRLQEDADF